MTTNIRKGGRKQCRNDGQFQSTLGRPRSGRPLGTAPTTCTSLSKSERPTCDQGADRRDQGSRNFLRNLLEADDDHQHGERDRQLVAVDLSELLKVVPELPQRTVAAPIQAQHAGDLPQSHLNADPGQEPDQHGAREEVGQESQAHEARQNQENRGHQR